MKKDENHVIFGNNPNLFGNKLNDVALVRSAEPLKGPKNNTWSIKK